MQGDLTLQVFQSTPIVLDASAATGPRGANLFGGSGSGVGITGSAAGERLSPGAGDGDPVFAGAGDDRIDLETGLDKTADGARAWMRSTSAPRRSP